MFDSHETGGSAVILKDYFSRNRQYFTRKSAWVRGESQVSYELFDSRVNRLVNGFRSLGVTQGERVVVLAQNRIEYLELYGSAEKGGLIVVPVDEGAGAEVLNYIVRDVEARAIVVSTEYAERVEHLKGRFSEDTVLISVGERRDGFINYEHLLADATDREPDCEVRPGVPAYIFYGKVKSGPLRGAVITHGAHIENVRGISMELGLSYHDVCAVTIPMSDIIGKTIASLLFYRGCTGLLLERDSNQSGLFNWNAGGLKITATAGGVDTLGVVEQEARTNPFLSGLHTVCYSGGGPDAGLAQRFNALGVSLVRLLGRPEWGGAGFVVSRQEHRFPGTWCRDDNLVYCGMPLIGVKAAVRDYTGCSAPPGEVGELVISSECQMKEYWRRGSEGLVIRGGWMWTGESAVLDEQGRVYLVR